MGSMPAVVRSNNYNICYNFILDSYPPLMPLVLVHIAQPMDEINVPMMQCENVSVSQVWLGERTLADTHQICQCDIAPVSYTTNLSRV
ncbi:hypothetical protein DMENIID0001_056480 [Sergentomyia squamirostris]